MTVWATGVQGACRKTLLDDEFVNLILLEERSGAIMAAALLPSIGATPAAPAEVTIVVTVLILVTAVIPISTKMPTYMTMRMLPIVLI